MAINLKDALKEIIPSSLHDFIPRSYDIVGSIAIVQIPDELEKYKEIIGETIAKINKRVKTVYRKGKTIGVERIRELELIYGIDQSETIHKENGCLYKLNVKKVFFNPRLAYERFRVASQVKDNEVVFDLFAGVGPFSILIAKMKKAKVYAIDINKDAYKYLLENIKLNKVESYVKAFLGDCRKVIRENDFEDIASRVIMNLPEKSEEFLDVATQVAKEECIIHFYHFLYEDEIPSKAFQLLQVIKDFGYNFKIANYRIVEEVGKRKYNVVFDVEIEKVNFKT